MEHIGHPIVGDEKYFRIENYEFPGGTQNKLHLWRGGSRCRIRAAARSTSLAPLPPHMQQS